MTDFSCREQMSQQTNRHALHLAEVMQMAQEQAGPHNPIHPEAYQACGGPFPT
jgi:hypothetical protein